MRIRHPWWAKEALTVKVNGKPAPVEKDHSGFVLVRRTWQNGDSIEVSFPMRLYTESMTDNQSRGGIVIWSGILPVNSANKCQIRYTEHLCS